MDAQTLNCPMCGAPASTDAVKCEHCGARLATVACPSCFGLMFVGAKFCSHCGARADRAEAAAAPPAPCPRCHIDMNAVIVGNTHLRECPKCEGIWADTASLQQICNDREQQAAVLGMAAPLPPEVAGNLEEKIHYLPCPVCKDLMNRVNFASCSHVIVDVCRKHGTWFDKDELRRIVEFIRAGGMQESREHEMRELEEQRRALETARSAGVMPDPGTASPRYGFGQSHRDGVSFAADAILSLLGLD